MKSTNAKRSPKITNRNFILWFRLAGFAIGVAGVVTSLLADPMGWLAYSVHVAAIVTVLFGVLVVKTLCAPKSQKSFGFYPRFSVAAAMLVLVASVGYWGMLVPFDESGASIWSHFVFHMFSLHFIIPAFIIFDIVMFNERGRLKKYDPFLFLIIPLIYMTTFLILGVNQVFEFHFMGMSSYFPYHFLDVDKYGWLVVLSMLTGTTISSLGMGYGWYWLDKRAARKTMR